MGDNAGQVEIFALGRFLMKRGGRMLSESALRSAKVWLLFKFLLTSRGRAYSPESVLEKLWPGREYPDPKQQMRILIYRLRHLLGGELAAPELASCIVFTQGCYRWSEKGDYRLDIDEFEKLALAAGEPRGIDPGRAVDLLRGAVRLYLGDYLPECSEEEWVLPARNYYHQLYINSMLQLLYLLKAEGRFGEIAGLCRNALEIEYFEEKLHLYYLEALLRDGKRIQARLHFEKATAIFYQEMRARPSEAMRLLYRRICFEQGENLDLSISSIRESLKEGEIADGAYLCDLELFRHLYRIEMRRLERSGQGACLGLLALTGPDFRGLPRDSLQGIMDTFQKVLRCNLRKGDVICRSNEAQFLLLLPGLGQVDAKKILLRMERAFQQECPLPGLVFNRRCLPLSSPDAASRLSI